MLCTIILISFVAILFFTKQLLNYKYGKISEIPLRKKIIDDSSNMILFSIALWCLMNTYYSHLPIISFLIISGSMLLFLYRRWLMKIFWLTVDKLREKIAFSIKFSVQLKRCLKNWEIDCSKNKKNDHNASTNVYREHVSLTIIYFCKSTIILAIALLGIMTVIKETNLNTYTLLLSGSEEYMSTFTDLFVLINNVGLVFTCWKFKCDYVASILEKSDDPRYLTIIRRLLRSEHEI